METPNENAGRSRSGMKRLIPPWEYRHLRVWAGARFAVGIFLAIFGALMLSSGFHRWVVLLLVAVALLFSFGYLEQQTHPAQSA